MQLIGYGKDYVIILRWKQLAHPIIYPVIPLGATTVWAVPIATTMILIMYMATTAVVALVDVYAYIFSVTLTQFIKYILTVFVKSCNRWMVEYLLLK